MKPRSNCTTPTVSRLTSPADVARERDLKVDEDGFNAAMDKQREMARAAGNFAGNYGKGLEIDGSTEFLGYTQLENTGAVKALFKDGVGG